jgi:hypothetical protein
MLARTFALTLLLTVPAVFIGTPSVSAQEPEAYHVTPEDLDSDPVYSPYVNRAYPDRVLFGDTHFHTNLSPDAGLLGTTLTPEEGFRFARGEKMISNTGQPVQLIRPLDFLAITDHAEYIGLAPMIRESNPILLATEYGRFLHDNFRSGPEGQMAAFSAILEDATTGNNRLGDSEMVPTIWREFIAIADKYNDPGTFTAMTGFEWSTTPGGDNLHRVVLFRDGADRTGQVLPFGTFDSEDPEDLWTYLDEYQQLTGGQALAIPHNGNLSNGLMFTDKKRDGSPMDRAYAENRLKWEPLHEMTQIKGDEETHPLLSPEDEFADFENWDVSNLDGSFPKEEWMLQHEYARPTLKLGLQLGARLGANPYKHGFIGTTDTHTGLSTHREENYWGKYAKTEPGPERQNHEVIPATDPALRIMTAQEAATGLVAVWARENTREDIFDSMRRKEVYATTGTRMRVRVFAGWNFEEDDIHAADFAAKGYRGGVPMGGELGSASDGQKPGFLVRALRDPDGANLDRVQVIKGWLDADGETHERIYDIAVSDGREADSDGRVKDVVGNTVDVETATYTNTIGDPLLYAFWEDPDFDPNEPAFYYIRVLEIPTPRWTTYDAAFYGIDLPDSVPATIQDRAYTSAIWYSP